jgi:N-acetylglucosaminyl-diphospho-decaprenol L-rhamnosyltransferase
VPLWRAEGKHGEDAGADRIVAMQLSYCVINTNGRDFLLDCLEAIRRTQPPDLEHEVIVVDNASDDGSAEAIADRFPEVRVIERDRRAGITENLNLLLREAQGRFVLFLNEDAELLPGAVDALLGALGSDPRAGAAGTMLLDPDHRPTACAWRRQGLGAALAGALFLHKWLVTQSGGARTREVGWVRTAAFLIRSEAAKEVGYFDTDYFFYGEDPDFQKRLRDAGWRILHVPAARVVHHEQASRDRAARARRVVEYHRSRDLYMRKHHSALAAAFARLLWAWSYVPRALAATLMPGRDPGFYWLHARQALHPARGDGMREAAAAYNLSSSGGPSAPRAGPPGLAPPGRQVHSPDPRLRR